MLTNQAPAWLRRVWCQTGSNTSRSTVRFHPPCVHGPPVCQSPDPQECLKRPGKHAAAVVACSKEHSYHKSEFSENPVGKTAPETLSAARPLPQESSFVSQSSTLVAAQSTPATLAAAPPAEHVDDTAPEVLHKTRCPSRHATITA